LTPLKSDTRISPTANEIARKAKENTMTIMTKKVAGFLFFQVVDAKGEVLQVLCSKEEAQAWIEAQK